MLSKATIKSLRGLQLKKIRSAERRFIAEGPKIVRELLQSPEWKVIHLYSTPGWEPQAIDTGIPATTITEAELAQISSLSSPNKVLALVAMKEVETLVECPAKGLHLLLDQVQDPGNLGTIIRIADWFGIDSIICSTDCADIYNPKVIQSSMGSMFRVPVNYVPLADVLIKNNEGSRLPVFATLLEGENIYNSKLPEDALIIMGNEGRGIHHLLLPFINSKLSIPGFSKGILKADSLNVAVATGIICSEFRRNMKGQA